MVATLIAILGAIIITGFAFANADAKLVVGSALFVAAGVIFTGGVKLHSEERDRAYRFLTENAGSADLLKSLGFITRFRKANDHLLTVEVATIIYTTDHRECKALIDSINVACNFFEEMAIGVRSRQINEYIIKEFYIGLVCRIGEYINPILCVLRNCPKISGHMYGDVEKPDVYCNMFWLYKRWAPDYESYQEPQQGVFQSASWTGRGTWGSASQS